MNYFSGNSQQSNHSIPQTELPLDLRGCGDGEEGPDKPSSWFRSTLLKQMKQLEGGSVTILEPGLEAEMLGNPDSADDLHVQLVVSDSRFYGKILFGGTIGSAESYMAGDWASDNLTDLIRVMIRNLRKMTVLEKSCAWLKNRWYWLQHVLRRNSIKGSRRNIHDHYDLGNDFYKLFLDPTMNYSSGTFASIGDDRVGDMHEASVRKMRLISEKLQLNASDHVLEIGTGWGGLAIFMAKHYGCRVTTTTISKEQFRYAVDAVADAGLQDRVQVLLKDYRQLEGKFDKIVSVEMIEAVGHQYYDEFFAKCSSLLKDSGVILLQAITIGEQNYDYHIRHVDFIRRYVFPGGCLPSIGALNRAAIKTTDMRVLHAEDLTVHYVHTLRNWRQSFMESLDEVSRLGYSDSFIRLWHFYLCYCEAAFAERRVHLTHLVYCKPACRIDPTIDYRADLVGNNPRTKVRSDREHAFVSHSNCLPDQLMAQKHDC